MACAAPKCVSTTKRVSQIPIPTSNWLNMHKDVNKNTQTHNAPKKISTQISSTESGDWTHISSLRQQQQAPQLQSALIT